MTKLKHLDAQILLPSSKHTKPLEKVPWALKGLKRLGKKVKTCEEKKKHLKGTTF